MSIVSYAQNFEDVMLWRALSHIERGLYIDIGAQDPVIDSVSLAFHEQGWQGLHVEPTPHYAELLRQQRPRDTVIQAAVGNGPAVLRFFEIPDTGISTGVASIAAQHRERGFEVHEITVPCITLAAIFDAAAGPEIHWLKIDVEGFEQQVLNSWGSSAARPWIVVVESTLPLTQIETHESWEPILVAYGYTPVYFDGLNRYYVSDAHKELKGAFASPPNVFDGFTLNGTASAPFHKLVEARYQEKINETLAQNELQRQSTKSEIERLTLSLASRDKTHAEHDQNRAKREQALSEKTSQAKQELEILLRKQVQREQEVAAQLLAIQQQAAQENTELARQHNEQERVLHCEHNGQLHTSAARERELGTQLLQLQQLALAQKDEHAKALAALGLKAEQALTQREQAVQTEFTALRQMLSQAESGAVEREKALSTLAQHALEKAHNEVQSHLKDLVEREHAMADQMARVQKEAQQAVAEQTRLHAERELGLGDQVSQLQRDNAVRERESNAALLTQNETCHALRLQLTELNHQIAAAHDLEATLRANMAQQAKQGAIMASEVAQMQQTFSWRLTAPLRRLTSRLDRRKSHPPAGASVASPSSINTDQ